MVTVTYEQQRGLREVHQKSDGYAASVSKTIDAPVSDLYEAWNDAKQRARWLKSKITIRKATPNKSMRITWPKDVTSVEVNFYPKSGNKSRLPCSTANWPHKRK